MIEPTHSSTEGLAERPARYDGALKQGMILTAPDNDGVLGLRRLKLLARHPDTDEWLCEELPSRLRVCVGSIRRCPEINLRIVFRPEEEPDEEPATDDDFPVPRELGRRFPFAELNAARKRMLPYLRGYPEPMIDVRRLRIVNERASQQDKREVLVEDALIFAWRRSGLLPRRAR